MNKLEKFAAMQTYNNVFQPQIDHSIYTQTNTETGGNDVVRLHAFLDANARPLTLELGCGRGEYTVALAQRNPEQTYIGVDIKGARMYTGATEALEKGLSNCAFLRTRIELIDRFFPALSISELWITFPDPQMQNHNKRLTSTPFLKRYAHILKPDAVIHLKTDSNFLYTYTYELLKANNIRPLVSTTDLYNDNNTELNPALREVQTAYEKQWLSRGIRIKYLAFKLLNNAKDLKEPEVEIELDAYRSYGRTQNSILQKHI